MKPTDLPERRSRRAFTLPEVTLALGIAAVALVALFGVMPNALNGNASAQHETRAIQIARRLFSQFGTQPMDQVKFNQYKPDGTDLPQQRLFAGVTSVVLKANIRGELFDGVGDGALFLDRPTAPTATPDVFAVYQVTLRFDTDPAVPEIANPAQGRRMTVRVAWQPYVTNYREYVRILRKNL